MKKIEQPTVLENETNAERINYLENKNSNLITERDNLMQDFKELKKGKAETFCGVEGESTKNKLQEITSRVEKIIFERLELVEELSNLKTNNF